jgi:hypothetical protein
VGLAALAAGSAPAKAADVAPAQCALSDERLPPWRAELDRVDATVRSLRDDVPIDKAWKPVQALLQGPCFRWARIALRDARPDSAAALRTWWKADGGQWLERSTQQPDKYRCVTLPPEFPPSLFLAGNEHEVETPILCAASDAACGADTRGWLERARASFDEHDDRWGQHADTEWSRSAAMKWWQARHECDKAAIAAKPSERLSTWLGCLAGRRNRIARFPAGRFRAPESGWLIVAGRRGHYQYCDGVAAFDLATGAAAAVRSCGALVLGAPDQLFMGKRQTTARKTETEIGKVSVENARELALNLLLLHRAKRLAVVASDLTIPSEVSLDGAPGGGPVTDQGTHWRSSAQTTLTWSWVEGGVTRARGQLTWRGSSRAEETHAADLLEVLETGLAPGCPPATLPTITVTNGSGEVSPIDANPDDNAATFSALRRAFQRATAACPPGRQPPKVLQVQP